MERWLPVAGYEGAYEVSDHGRVRSLDRVEQYERRDQYSGRVLTVRRGHRGRLLSPGRMNGGHLSVALSRGNSQLVHVLVLTAFVGPCPIGCECLHRNGIPSVNHLANLRWGTRAENVADAIAHGAMPVGDQKWNAKLREQDIPGIVERFGRHSFAAIARDFGVREATIRNIANGRTWQHVPAAKANARHRLKQRAA